MSVVVSKVLKIEIWSDYNWEALEVFVREISFICRDYQKANNKVTKQLVSRNIIEVKVKKAKI